MKTEETQATHTPGKWEAHGCTVYQADNWKDGVNHGGKFICGIDSFEGPLPTEERRLNARLIAAAPELLEACKVLLSKLPYGNEALEIATQELITKATQS